jgi:DNA repair protein RadC
MGRAAQLKAGSALAERAWVRTLVERSVFDSSASVLSFLRARLARRDREVFGVLFLDARHRLIAFEELFLGSIDRASVHPREVLRRALVLNAAALILAHNHPSGVAEPSASDLALTRELGDLLGRIDVRLLDHVVVTPGQQVSLAERGLL